MKTIKLITLAVFIISLTACPRKPTVEELQKFAATEIFPEDTFLITVANKRALIIVAHDDDDCIMSGTIAKLTSSGWIIKQLSFDVNKIPGEDRNPAHIICEGYERILEDGIYRPGVDTVKYRWRAIPYAEIKNQYLHEKATDALIPKVNEFNPSVLFTLDNIKGWYGNPDHVFLSQLVLDLYKEGSINAERIYQAVITRHMETERDKWLIPRMEKWGFPQLFPTDNEIYGIEGIPEPDVQINITEQAETKMRYKSLLLLVFCLVPMVSIAQLSLTIEINKLRNNNGHVPLELTNENEAQLTGPPSFERTVFELKESEVIKCKPKYL